MGSTATLTTKGQVTIPKDVRDDLGLAPGTIVVFTRTADGVYLLHRPDERAVDLFGAVPHDGPARSLADMDEAIAAGASGDEA